MRIKVDSSGLIARGGFPFLMADAPKYVLQFFCKIIVTATASSFVFPQQSAPTPSRRTAEERFKALAICAVFVQPGAVFTLLTVRPTICAKSSRSGFNCTPEWETARISGLLLKSIWLIHEFVLYIS